MTDENRPRAPRCELHLIKPVAAQQLFDLLEQ